MVFGTPELVVILVLALVLFGPQKLPELARAIGQAVGEYNKAKREFEQEVNKAKSEIEKEARDINRDVMVEESRKNSAEIRKIARGLGISTEGKDDSTLLKEIEERTTKKRAPSSLPIAPGAVGMRKPFTTGRPAKTKTTASSRTDVKRKPKPSAKRGEKGKTAGESKRSN